MTCVEDIEQVSDKAAPGKPVSQSSARPPSTLVPCSSLNPILNLHTTNLG